MNNSFSAKRVFEVRDSISLTTISWHNSLETAWNAMMNCSGSYAEIRNHKTGEIIK